jgi:hypothetical protein
MVDNLEPMIRRLVASIPPIEITCPKCETSGERGLCRERILRENRKLKKARAYCVCEIVKCCVS